MPDNEQTGGEREVLARLDDFSAAQVRDAIATALAHDPRARVRVRVPAAHGEHHTDLAIRKVVLGDGGGWDVVLETEDF